MITAERDVATVERTRLLDRIERLRHERNAVILAHNYQRPEVQDIADFVGDSLGLSQQAAATDADVIVFCGVHFMAETAAILCPEKTVLLPDLRAGCSLAAAITADELRAWKARFPESRCGGWERRPIWPAPRFSWPRRCRLTLSGRPSWSMAG